MKHLIIAVAALCTVFPALGLAENQPYVDPYEDALVTDRPDAAEASATVGKNRFQIESSFQFGQDQAAGTTTRNYSFPTLLRYGIIDALELRVETEVGTFQTDNSGAAAQRGFNDVAFGLKANFTENQGLVPSFGLLGHLNVPIGNDTFSSNGVEPIFKALADWELGAGFGLGTNVGVDLPVRDAAGDKFGRFIYAAALGRAIPGTSDRLGAFIEAAGAVPLKQAKAQEHTFDTGLKFLITPNLQVDTVVQIGLNDDAADLALGSGLSWRI